MSKKPILVIAGTNRPGANAMNIARIVLGHYQVAGIAAELYSLTEMPPEIFDPASYGSKPAAWQAVQQRVLDAAGLHLVVPEYNGSYPGVLKYFIDMLKFPESFEQKPAAFVGEARGMWAGLRGVEQLQQVFGYRNGYLYPQRVFIPAVHEKLDADGRLLDPAINQRLIEQCRGFAAFAQSLGSHAGQ